MRAATPIEELHFQNNSGCQHILGKLRPLLHQRGGMDGKCGNARGHPTGEAKISQIKEERMNCFPILFRTSVMMPPDVKLSKPTSTSTYEGEVRSAGVR